MLSIAVKIYLIYNKKDRNINMKTLRNVSKNIQQIESIGQATLKIAEKRSQKHDINENASTRVSLFL